MASAIAVSTNKPSSKESSFFSVIILSLIFHVIVFVGIPLLAHIMYRAEKYSRPSTFQLVSPAHINVQIASIPQQKAAAARPKKAESTPVPKKRKTAAEPKKQEENTNDLSELLEAVQTINVSEIAPSQDFKYHWYLQNLVSKVEEQWKPPLGLTEKKDPAVIIAFTILQNGSIAGVSVATSSGVSTLDNLALRAIQLAAPFGKLPIGFTENKLDITYTLHYVK
jgi:TonB family protein